jgi:hypothetical protein
MTPSTFESFADSLWQQAEELTKRNSREGAPRGTPPIITAQSPLHELLYEEIAASIPPEVALKLRAVRSVVHAHDWIAAGAMYTWIKSNDLLAKQFLGALGDRPREAALALAKTVARTLEPPPPDARAPNLDRLGLAIQGFFAILILGVRGLFFAYLFSLVTGRDWSIELLRHVTTFSLVPNLMWLDVSGATHVDFLVLACGSGVLFLECLFVPRWLEYCRRFPLRRLPIRVYADWRVDSLLVFWSAHGTGLQVILVAQAIRFAIKSGHMTWESPLAGAAICWIALSALAQAILTIRYLTSRG